VRSFWLKSFKVIIAGFVLLGVIGLSVMMIMTVVNISLRELVALPICGAIEVVGFGGVLLFSSAIIYCQLHRREVVVTVLVDRLPERLQGILGVVSLVISLCTVAIIGMAAFAVSWEAVTTGELTEVIGIQIAPFRAIWTFGCIVLFAVLLRQLYAALSGRREK
jgi:TRAP-type C4-dicarboxylate transport system permease small subunit